MNPEQLDLGKPVRCTDGPFGELHDVVIDPVHNRVTHLVVHGKEVPASGRLVPIELADMVADAAEISLRCTVQEGHGLPSVQEVAQLGSGERPHDDPESDIGVQDVLPTPHYDAGAMVEYYPEPDPEILMLYDRVPKGEVEIRRESPVTTADGHQVGRVDGLIIDQGDITHVVVRHGHLWRRRKLAVPIASVAKVGTDNVELRISKAELKRLPASR